MAFSGMDLVGSVISSVLSGGATGLLGLALQQFGEWGKRAQDIELLKLQHLQAVELRRIEKEQAVELAQLGAQAVEWAAERDLVARLDATASADMGASFAADRASYLLPQAQTQSAGLRWLMAVVDFLRGIVRPGVTVYSMVLLTLLMWWVQSLYSRIGEQLTPMQAERLALDIVGTITYLAVTCTVWWFGVRPGQRGGRS